MSPPAIVNNLRRVIDANGRFLYDAAPGYVPEAGTVEVDAPAPAGLECPRWDGAQWVEDETAEEAAARLERAGRFARTWRNAELARTDWTQVTDAPVDRAAWAAYRQQLRDWPQSTSFPGTRPARPA